MLSRRGRRCFVLDSFPEPGSTSKASIDAFRAACSGSSLHLNFKSLLDLLVADWQDFESSLSLGVNDVEETITGWEVEVIIQGCRAADETAGSISQH